MLCYVMLYFSQIIRISEDLLYYIAVLVARLYHAAGIFPLVSMIKHAILQHTDVRLYSTFFTQLLRTIKE